MTFSVYGGIVFVEKYFYMQKRKQKIIQYPALFEPAKEGGFNVSFPSFPGCVTFGRTFEEAKKMAQQVLELWLEELASEGSRIPAHRYRPIVADVEAVVPKQGHLSYASN